MSEDEAGAVLRLAGEAATHDGVDPLSEDVLLHVRYGGDPAALNLLLWQGSRLAGFAHLGPANPADPADPADPAEGRSGELLVHPASRRRGLGRALAGELLARAGGQPVQLWAHGDLPAAAKLAVAAGFSRVRALWRMTRSLRTPLPEPHLPPEVTLRPFVPGQDEEAWTELNAHAFAQHPEQGRWTREDLARREHEPWFDPAGFFLAERAGRLAGFHWTKTHAHRPGSAGPVGEVYVVGVSPGERGTGLGRALTLAGLHHLRNRGLPEVMLYVDESNTVAIALYQSLGFARGQTDVMYRHPAVPNDPVR